MQVENETSRNFSKRTDALALALGIDLGGLAERLEMGRASFFSYRTGKRPISGKAWAKLTAAERAAGIGAFAPEPEPPPRPPSSSLAAMTLSDLIETLPESARPIAARFALATMEDTLLSHLTSAEGLAHTVQAHLAGDDSDEVSESLAAYPEVIINGTDAAKEIVSHLVQALSGDRPHESSSP